MPDLSLVYRYYNLSEGKVWLIKVDEDESTADWREPGRVETQQAVMLTYC